MDRKSLLFEGKQRGSSIYEFSIVLDYKIQFRQVEKIITKHWIILKKDRILGPPLPPSPGFIYVEELQH